MTPLLFSNAIKREFMRYFQKQPPDVLFKKGVLKISQGNIFVESLLIKLQAFKLADLLKRDFNTGVFKVHL